MGSRLASAAARYQALLELLRAADAIWNGSRALFGKWNLGPSQFNVLNLLRGNPSGLSQTDLGRRLIMHRSNITGLVDRLEQRGLVRRQEAAGDRRAYRVMLTPGGRRLLRKVLPEYFIRADTLWEGVGPKRVAEVVSVLQTVGRNAERAARAAGGSRKP
jgi:DNA-binding MarR family transcriptional regulator